MFVREQRKEEIAVTEALLFLSVHSSHWKDSQS